MESVAIIAIITSLGSLLVIFGKTIKNSTCLGCLKCETRTPQISVSNLNLQSTEKKEKITNETIV